VLRLLPPLIVTEDDIREAVDKLGAAFCRDRRRNRQKNM